MTDLFFLKTPELIPPLDPDFKPAALANRKFAKEVESSGGGVPLIISLERRDGSLSRFETRLLPDGHPLEAANRFYAERLLKFLLWQRGGWKVYLGGPESVGRHIKNQYSVSGAREFDYRFMGETVYESPFTVICCHPEDVPPEKPFEKPLGRNLDGCRIGFDLGASDLKVSAVVDGAAVFSTEIEWAPMVQIDPNYHMEKITAALKLAASKLPRVDAVGGSSAGVYVNNRPMVASLFRGIPEDQFEQIRSMFIRIRDDMGVPLEVVNDGEVTALAGSMALEDSGVLGIALGSSEAAGYVNLSGNITDGLNELAFAPVDYNPEAPIDEWSGDRGCGALYFSQQCVFRLAPPAGIDIPGDVSDAQRLAFVQKHLESGHTGAEKIWQSMGCYMGYTIAHYADFYDFRHVLILGRCTSGRGGNMIIDGAGQVLKTEFPEIDSKINIQLPDEKIRRVGQSIAAACLPEIA